MRQTLSLILLLCASWCVGQTTVYGTITDERGEALAFATVRVAGTESGTAASLAGDYSLVVPASQTAVRLVFRYIGYESRTVATDLSSERKRVDVQLQPATYALDAATVSAGAEDPAYRIMREAAARRERYLRSDERYEVDGYVKGLLRIDSAPERIMGQEIGDMGGLLDTGRAGIVYLSETYSTLQFEQPDRFRETVTASQVSGDPRGYSFNSSVGIDFDLYRRTTEYNKPILSPLAETAPRTYRFALDGARRASNGRLVYRISVDPRDRFAPAYSGMLYVEDSTYHLLDANLYVLGTSLGAAGLDTLFIRQSYRQRGDGGWQVEQRRLEPVLSLLAFRFRGAFTAVYSDYDYNPQWETSPFGKTVVEVQEESNTVDSSTWDARPIPLTRAEVRDYLRKDSIRQRLEAPAYRDSVQARRNRFTLGALLGYTYTNWRRNERLSYTSPLTDAGFHSVTGVQLGAGISYAKAPDEQRSREWELGAGLRYGWADTRFYPSAKVAYHYSRTYNSTLRLSAGRELADYHRLEPVSERWNTNYSLFAKRNPRKLYERRSLALRHATDLRDRDGYPVARLSHQLMYARRQSRDNASQYSLRRKERRYAPNLPNAPLAEGSERYVDFVADTLLTYAGELSFVPNQRFSVRPGIYTPLPNPAPTLSLRWRYGRQLRSPNALALFTTTRYLFAELSARWEDVQLGRAGKLSARTSAGSALGYRGSEHPIYLQQFAGSELLFNAYTDYLERYLGLAHYGFTTRGSWLSHVVEHDFDGAVWRRLPLLRRLGWHVVLRSGGIYLPREGRLHQEFGAALSNIGFGPARFIRADVVWRNDALRGAGIEWRRPVYRLGLNIPLAAVLEGGDLEL